MNPFPNVVEDSKSQALDAQDVATLPSVTMSTPPSGDEESSSCSNRLTALSSVQSRVAGEHEHNSGFSSSSSAVICPIARKVVEDDVDADGGVIAAPPAHSPATNTRLTEVSPTEIPPEPPSGELGGIDGTVDVSADGDGVSGVHNQGNEDDEEESEYEYEDEDDAAFSGFIVQHSALTSLSRSSDEDNNNDNNHTATVDAVSPARIQDEESVTAMSNETRKGKWREPSREAVSMSLRAEEEKTGGKRRLAQDLYRIMNQGHDEAGFSIAPKSEDTMDKWIIKLFKFDEDSNLAKDMVVLGFEHIELEMTFPDQYPFEPPFVRVVRPRFKRQTGFVMNGALCMELLTKDGWNPVNDIESVIVSIRSLLVVGDGRLQTAYDMSDSKYQARLKASQERDGEGEGEEEGESCRKRQRRSFVSPKRKNDVNRRVSQDEAGSYSLAEAHAAYSHLSDYHKKKGWDSSGWWARKG